MGASRGIGAAIGLRASREGASVAFAARNRDGLESVVARCPGKALAISCDVRDAARCGSAVARSVDQFGGLDALVYSTGISRFTELAGATADDWRVVFETNVMGAGVLTAAALPHLRAAAGHAIYLSSEAALYRPPWRGIGLYIASKLALESMVRSFQLEVPEVAFTNYVVGATTTVFGNEQPEQLAKFTADWYARGYVTPDLLDPETHAEMVLGILTANAWVDRVGVRVRGTT